MASSPPVAASPAASISSSYTSPPLHAPKVRRKPLPEHAPVTSTLYNPSPLSIEGNKPTPIPTPRPESLSSVEADYDISVPRNSNRFSRGRSSTQPLQIDTSANAAFLRSVVEDDEDDDEEGADYFDDEYEHQFTNGIGTPLHSRLVSEPFIPVLNSPPPTQRRATSMALHPPLNRPPPLKLDVDGRSMSMGPDPRQPKTPGNKISSFFGWKGNANANGHNGPYNVATSPGGESSSTEISDGGGGRSPMPSPMPPLANVPFDANGRAGSVGTLSAQEAMFASRMSDVENELREISSELAGSIRREMELEDLIERLQSEGPDANRRTSDYFSDSGTGSVRNPSDAGRASVEDIEKIRRAAEQERAQLKVDMAQKLQDERTRRTASESHVQILENQVQQLRRDRAENSDLASKTSNLERALEDNKRKLLEERQSKDNFEDLLTAMRVELEQLRNDRDMLRQGKAPPSEMQRLIEEIEALKIENASLAQLQGGRFASIAEEGGAAKRNSAFGLSRSNSLARKPNGLSRSNSVSTREREQQSGESLVDQVKNIEAQRDALHRTLKSLLDRHELQAREFEKRARMMDLELQRAQQTPHRRPGYQREVGGLREDVNHLRMRAEDALDSKWQCEKNLAGLKMDLDRAEQETVYLRELLQEDSGNSENGEESFAEVMAISSSLESAFQQLQAEGSGDQFTSSVQQQLQQNSALRTRFENEINKGERGQKLSVERIHALQSRMKELEDGVLAAQNHSEEEMSKHEEEIRQMKESHNDQLVRMKNGSRTAMALSPRPPNAPFSTRSPRLDHTTSGQGLPLADVVQAEILEKRVKELEKVLRDADMEMEEVIGQMNRAQADVAQLQSDRDDALRQTRQLQAEIEAARGA